MSNKLSQLTPILGATSVQLLDAIHCNYNEKCFIFPVKDSFSIGFWKNIN